VAAAFGSSTPTINEPVAGCQYVRHSDFVLENSLSVSVTPAPEAEITDLADLPPAIRAAKFRELAFQAKCSAARTEGAQRQTLMASAGIWQRLANLAEQEIQVNKVFDTKAGSQ
jgi:hypothetical protein